MFAAIASNDHVELQGLNLKPEDLAVRNEVRVCFRQFPGILNLNFDFRAFSTGRPPAIALCGLTWLFKYGWNIVSPQGGPERPHICAYRCRQAAILVPCRPVRSCCDVGRRHTTSYALPCKP